MLAGAGVRPGCGLLQGVLAGDVNGNDDVEVVNEELRLIDLMRDRIDIVFDQSLVLIFYFLHYHGQ